MPATARAPVAPPDVARQVRSALGSLYDPVALRAHPLARGLGVDARALRERMLDAIEAMEPGPRVDEGARAWRLYHLLRSRYVEARDPADVARDLGLSRSQYYREHEHALEQLTALLRERFPVGPAAADSGPPSPTPRYNLPLPITRFIGRARELAEVRRLLAMTRLLTLTGAGGSGKTRLALEAAAALRADYPDGVCLAELAPVAAPGLVPQTLAAALGIREAAGEPLEATLVRTLAGGRRVLVLDNCEHVIDAAARLVEALLRDCPNLVMLATSREPLRIAGETVLRVPPLSLPPHDPASPDPDTPRGDDATRGIDPDGASVVGEVEGYEAVELFIDRAAAALPGFALTPENAPAIAGICRRLDGIPLAIELAAARVPLLSPHQIAERLHDSFHLLTDGSRTALPRHRTLRAMVDWSFELLSEPERAVLRRLSVFAGGWTLEAAEAVCADPPVPAPEAETRRRGDPAAECAPLAASGVGKGEVLDLLGRLVSKSLVVAEPAGPQSVRYRMLETFRQYGQEQLVARGERACRFEAHARYFLALAEAGDRGVASTDQVHWVERLDAERDNFRVTLGRCRGDELPPAVRHDVGPALASRLFKFWAARTQLREAAHWLAAMARFPATPAVAICQAQGSYFNSLVGNAALARSLADGAVDRADELNDVEARCWAHASRAVTYVFSGDAAAAEPHARLAVGLADAGPDPWLPAYARVILGATLTNLRRAGEADEVLSGALALARALGERQMIGLSLAYLGQLSLLQRDDALAETRLTEAVRVLGEIGSPQVLRPANLLAQLALQQGDAERARARYRHNVEAARDAGWREHLVNALAGLAMTESVAGRPRSAARLFGAVSALRAGGGTGAPSAQRAEEERHLAAVRARRSESEFDLSWTRGAAMGADEAVDAALSRSSD